jgi:UDPglucose--hexose-1-phosphate uridylyltransferase
MIERNPITGDARLLAPNREQRPNAYREGIDRCPFCAGHESDTPPEIWRDGTPWRVRVFPNKYPATERHEVIVETPDHDASFDKLPPDHAAAAVDAYISRYYSARDTYICIFKNHGHQAGASIPHEHSQLIATPFLPERVEREGAAFGSRCPLCFIDDQPLIAETDDFRWIAPRGASMAWEQWIVPRGHQPEMRDAFGLGDLLQRSTRAMLTIADSFNWIFMNFPQHPRAHWYVQLFPRTSVVAGFETGSGSAINTTDPAEAARRLAGASRP